MTSSKHNSIIDDYRNTRSRVADIAEKHGVTQQWVYQLLNTHGVPRRATVGVRLTHTSEPTVRKPLSPTHIAIGGIINARRRRAGSTIEEFAAEVGLSQSNLRRVEAGTYDVTLCEMQNICRLLKLSVDQVVQSAALIERQA